MWLNHIQFWYFDTNISEQGEELYIYMNARGERMQSTENLKAELLSNVTLQEEKNEWGKKWEEWQDDFWLIRGKHGNADNVFNEFIYCIAGLENQKNNIGVFISTTNKGFLPPTNSELLKCFKYGNISVIDKYINALKLILRNEIVDFCKSINLNHNWIIKTKNEIRKLLNDNETNYFIKIDDPNRGTEQNRMVLLWSVLELFSNVETIDLNLIISFRIVYNRYHNYNRSVLTNLNDVLNFKNEGFETVLKENNNEEEALKYQYLKNQKHQLIFNELLSLIWQIEDHPTNLNGRDVGNTNSIHLIDYKSNLSLELLELIKQKFYELIPLDEKGKEVWDNYGKLINCLIAYGKCWNAKVTNGYDNFDFDNERRIVRDVDAGDNKCFSRFFNDYLKSDSLKDLENKILTEPNYSEETEDWLEILQWYNFKLREEMWSQGYYIAVGGWDYRKKDKYFPNRFQFVNTKEAFKEVILLNYQVK